MLKFFNLSGGLSGDLSGGKVFIKNICLDLYGFFSFKNFK